MPHIRLKILITVGVIAIVVIGAYATWYSYERHEKLVQAEACNEMLAHPPAPTMVTGPDGAPAPLYALNGCIAVVVPPSLGDLLRGRIVFENVPQRMKVNPYSFTDILLGRYTFGPADVGCDQSATTTDCASLPAAAPAPQPAAPGVVNATGTVGNFSFGYPEGQGRLSEFGWEGVVEPGNYTLVINGITNYDLFIFTVPSPLNSLDPVATSLDDYRTDYPIAATSTRQILVNGTPTTIETRAQVRILSSEDVTINGIPMLRQRYSVGEWLLDAKGNRVFDTSMEADVTDELRYVFFDGKTFVVLTGWQADDTIDYVARTIRLSTGPDHAATAILACYHQDPGSDANTPIPNDSVQRVNETSRLFISMPKDLYPKDISHSWTTVSGNATAGYVSNGGLPGEAMNALPGCWSTYVEFEGSGEVDLRVKSVVPGAPDYSVRFIVGGV